MASPVTLFVVEGEKRDVRFLKNLAEELTSGVRTIKILVLPAAQNIYMLYGRLKEDDFETDIVEVLRESSTKASKELKGLQRDDVDEVYLFFDFSKYRRCVTPSLIHCKQEKILNTGDVVFCLSALPEFLLDYYGEEYWYKNIDEITIDRTACQNRFQE